MGGLGCLHDRKVVASLKWDSWPRRHPHRGESPRPKGRGFVEGGHTWLVERQLDSCEEADAVVPPNPDEERALDPGSELNPQMVPGPGGQMLRNSNVP